MSLFLNGYPVEFSAPTFTAHGDSPPDPKQPKDLRSQLGTEWFTHWRSGKVYAIPNLPHPAVQYGTPTTLECADHDNLHVLTARITDRLPSCFPQYEAFCRRPFAFLGRKDEFVSKITERWKNVPTLVRQFEIRPRFELDPRIIELRDGVTTIALFLAVSTRWDIRQDGRPSLDCRPRPHCR